MYTLWIRSVHLLFKVHLLVALTRVWPSCKSFSKFVSQSKCIHSQMQASFNTEDDTNILFIRITICSSIVIPLLICIYVNNEKQDGNWLVLNGFALFIKIIVFRCMWFSPTLWLVAFDIVTQRTTQVKHNIFRSCNSMWGCFSWHLIT